MIPADLRAWPEDQRLQWLADELWTAATREEDPAPPDFVAEVAELLKWYAEATP